MKLIKTQFPVLASAQTGRMNIVAAKMLMFGLIDENTAYAEVAYFEMLENVGNVIDTPLYTAKALNVTGSIANRPNVKRIAFNSELAATIWNVIGGEVVKGGDLLKSLSDQFTIATLAKLVYDGNFIKVQNDELVPLSNEDWQIVDQPQLITQEDLDRWAAIEVNLEVKAD